MNVEGLYSCSALGSSSPEVHKQLTLCYKFMYISTKSYIFKSYVLILLAVPKITATEAIPNPRIGESFFLECSVAGIPDPTIVWVKDGFPLNTSNFPMVSLLSRPKASHIVVSKATGIEYNGMYTCIASNDAGSVSSSFLIRLQGQQHDYKLAIISSHYYSDLS